MFSDKFTFFARLGSESSSKHEVFEDKTCFSIAMINRNEVVNMGGFMSQTLKRLIQWIYGAVEDKRNAPLSEIKLMLVDQSKRFDRLETKVEQLYEHDAEAIECDLSVMDDRICYIIGACRRRGYTTADERRRVTRMHDAYRARGGNHGEENEYAVFLTLPTEEEHNRLKGA